MSWEPNDERDGSAAKRLLMDLHFAQFLDVVRDRMQRVQDTALLGRLGAYEDYVQQQAAYEALHWVVNLASNLSAQLDEQTQGDAAGE